MTDETTTGYSPSPRLIEAGGQPGEKLNALRFDVPILDPAATADADLRTLDLHTEPLKSTNVKNTTHNARPECKSSGEVRLGEKGPSVQRKI